MSTIFKVLFTLIGAIAGTVIVSFLDDFEPFTAITNQKIVTIISVAIILLFAFIFYLLSPKVLGALEDLLNVWETEIQTRPLSEVLLGAVGLIIGFIIAFLISQPIYKIPIPYMGAVISIVLYGMFGFLGLRIGMSNKDAISEKFKLVLSNNTKKVSKNKDKAKEYDGIPKVLDTSVIIDGRILDIVKSGFWKDRWLFLCLF